MPPLVPASSLAGSRICLSMRTRPASTESRRYREASERAYAQWVSPWVRTAVTPESARQLRQWHPMRLSRQIWSEKANPVLAWLPWTRQWLDQWDARDSDRAGNPWYQLERVSADACAQACESWRTGRDLWAEVLFQQLYAS